MNFKEFIHKNLNCPCCGNKLHLKLSTSRDYKLRYENDLIVFSTTMKSLSSNGSNIGIDLKVSPEDGSFYIDFYDRSLKLMNNYIPFSFMKSFKEFESNQKNWVFDRRCGMCYQYSYSSTPFKLDYKTGTLTEMYISSENICYYKKVDEENTRVFKIQYESKSEITTIKYKETKTKDLENMYPFTGMHLEYENKIICPYKLDVFNPSDVNIDKLETLLTFS